MSLLQIEALNAVFPTKAGPLHAVNDVSLSVRPGEVLGIVGESGSGKTVTCLSVVGLLGPRVQLSGNIVFNGKAIPAARIPFLGESERLSVSMIFQDPGSSLNPVRTIGAQIAEVLVYGRGFARAQAEAEAVALLGKVGIPEPESRMRAYPHQLSGGMNQRVMIAMALAAAPQLLIADEPTTALDVTVQAQICALLRQLVKSSDLAIVFISHDLDLVAQFCDRVAVMYAGSLIEQQSAADIVRRPRHPYTQALLGAIPGHRPPLSRLGDIPGEIRTHFAPPAECPFRPRCSRAIDRCGRELPELRQEGVARFACFNPLPP